jgi:uncharacterized membrane protein HdeD (DUF308 family)
MADFTERTLGYGFALIGGVLIALAGLISLAAGGFQLAFGHATSALNAWSEGLVLLVVGGLAIFFAWLAHRQWSGRLLASGVLLVVLAGIGWAVLGLEGNVVAMIGAIFVFLAGVLYLVVPVKTEVAHAISS